MEVVIEKIKKAEYEWWLTECEKIQHAKESGKWRIISRLTNQSMSEGVQPLQKTINGKQVYLFEDDEIRRELEDYHIRKEQNVEDQSEQFQKEIDNTTKNLAQQARNGNDNFCMDPDISDYGMK